MLVMLCGYPSQYNFSPVHILLSPHCSSAYNMMWTSVPSTVNSTQHYMFKVNGAKSTSDVCVQGFTNQPAGTCAVQFQGRTKCFM